MITIRDLHKAYRRCRVLDGLDLDARPGEVTLLVGANGTGKTTLLKQVCGLSTPDAGRIVIAGADLATFNDATDFPQPEGRIVAGFDVGRTRDYSELAVFEERGPRFVCRMLKRFEHVPFAEHPSGSRYW